MGEFIKAEEVKKRTRNSELQSMATDDIDFIYIEAAERAIEQAMRLELDTDGFPRRWAGRMRATARLEDEYRADFEKAAFMTVEHMASNPGGFKAEAFGGGSVQHDRDIVPPAAKVLMRKWSQPRRIGRA